MDEKQEEDEMMAIFIGGDKSGISLSAMPPKKFNCTEFTLRDDVPQKFLEAPWIQFASIEMDAWRAKMAGEVARRATMYNGLIDKIKTLQRRHEENLDHIDHLTAQREAAFKMWKADRKKMGLPEDFSDIKEWPDVLINK